ncbi:MAG: hypothetical protein A3G13_00010 [Candidatus Levybacteria bacterium RIFCSPLOWO2_12_FULL_37_7]|nr:MAG: hypothetical protein A3G13_00010 [Candidatus Levybacteria bacterium RIFCSPLOWO2_12_FULL_37_7]
MGIDNNNPQSNPNQFTQESAQQDKLKQNPGNDSKKSLKINPWSSKWMTIGLAIVLGIINIQFYLDPKAEPSRKVVATVLLLLFSGILLFIFYVYTKLANKLYLAENPFLRKLSLLPGFIVIVALGWWYYGIAGAAIASFALISLFLILDTYIKPQLSPNSQGFRKFLFHLYATEDKDFANNLSTPTQHLAPDKSTTFFSINILKNNRVLQTFLLSIVFIVLDIFFIGQFDPESFIAEALFFLLVVVLSPVALASFTHAILQLIDWSPPDASETDQTIFQFAQQGFMKRYGKYIKYIIAALYIFCIAIGTYAFLKSGKPNQEISQEPSAPMEASSYPTKQEVTASWNTYKSDFYKFSFKHPSEWEVEEIGSYGKEPGGYDSLVLTTGGKTILSIIVYSETAYIPKSNDFERVIASSIKVGGSSAMQYDIEVTADPKPPVELPYPKGAKYTDIYVERNGGGYLVIEYADEGVSEIYKEVIKTFKFTKFTE